ncbi:hypothetical protein P7K49_013056 [Saguinus oedipus]|uniref:Uncharacterized protein n=1 Tax=Saguinus oedipus TaxID=9490 RepID=A0ABQ9VET5_SAGOE|nr:hypothetical protein P7K49_013056 [Saguinus oedipus]
MTFPRPQDGTEEIPNHSQQKLVRESGASHSRGSAGKREAGEKEQGETVSVLATVAFLEFGVASERRPRDKLKEAWQAHSSRWAHHRLHQPLCSTHPRAPEHAGKGQ